MCRNDNKQYASQCFCIPQKVIFNLRNQATFNLPNDTMMNDYKPMDIANFAVASSVLKHTIRGDANITDNATEIKNIMNQNFDIKR